MPNGKQTAKPRLPTGERKRSGGKNGVLLARADTYSNRNPASYRLASTEPIAEVSGSTGYQFTALGLSPSSSTVFGWLSNIAKRYDQYRVHKMHIRYETRTAATKTGSVMLFLDYDSKDQAPLDAAQFLGNYGARECATWENMVLKLDIGAVHALAKRKRVRGLSNLVNRTLTDIGRLFIGTSGQDNTNAVGRVFVDYDIEFFAPTIDNGGAIAPLPTCLFSSGYYSNQALPNGVQTALVIYPVIAGSAYVLNPCGFGSTGTTDVVLPFGYWMMMIETNVVFGAPAVNDNVRVDLELLVDGVLSDVTWNGHLTQQSTHSTNVPNSLSKVIGITATGGSSIQVRAKAQYSQAQSCNCDRIVVVCLPLS